MISKKYIYYLLFLLFIFIISIILYRNYNMNYFYNKSIYKAPYKILAIGDLHGDYKATLNVLKKAKIIDKKKNWIAGKAHVVQLGDILDRKPRSINNSDEDSEFKIFNLLNKLQRQAFKVGGAFHCIMGNHEILNLLGEFDYVSNMGMKHFKSKEDRKEFFKPGGKIAKKFSNTWNTIIKIGKFVFVHGGLTEELSSKYKIPYMNKVMKLFLDGKIDQYNKRFNELFLRSNSLLWTRKFSDGDIDCDELRRSLKYQNAKSLVVGHTPQMKGINNVCGLVWRIDTGMSRAFGNYDNNRIQILKIINNGKKISIIK